MAVNLALKEILALEKSWSPKKSRHDGQSIS